MISLNLIKSNNEMVIEITQFEFLVRGLKDESTESKITEFGFDFVKKSSNEHKRNF